MIVAVQELPYRVPDGTLMSSESMITIGGFSPDLLFASTGNESYLPVGGLINVNTREKKCRIIERQGNVHIERYVVRADRKHQTADMDVLFMRIFDGVDPYPKLLLNKEGIGRLITAWAPTDLHIPVPEYALQTDSYFLNDLYLNMVQEGIDGISMNMIYDSVGATYDSSNGLMNYYQNDVGDLDGLLRFYRNLCDELVGEHYAGIRHDIAMKYSNSINQYIAVDTGKFPQIDPMTWITRDGTLSSSDIRKEYTRTDYNLTMEDRPAVKKPTSYLLPLTDKFSRLISLLQLSPLTECRFRYILPTRLSKQGTIEVTTCICRYGYREDIATTHVNAIAQEVTKLFPDAKSFTVTLSWNYDASIMVYYRHHVEKYYVDLFLATLLSRSLVHLDCGYKYSRVE